MSESFRIALMAKRFIVEEKQGNFVSRPEDFQGSSVNFMSFVDDLYENFTSPSMEKHPCESCGDEANQYFAFWSDTT